MTVCCPQVWRPQANWTWRLTPFTSPPNHQKSIHELITSSLNNCYKNFHYLSKVWTHDFKSINPSAALFAWQGNKDILYHFTPNSWEGHFLGRLIRSLGVPKGRGVWNSQGRRKDKLFFPLHSLGLYNKNVSFLRTVSGLNLLANPVILKCKLWE